MKFRNTNSFIPAALICSVALPVYAANDRLEEVIVTAQKREQNLQDVPMAITALGRALLEDNEINSVEDLTKLVPSLRFTPGDDPSNSSIRVRGVGTDVFSVSVEPNVSVLVDEVPLARTEMASFEFADLERIEVLRGPQGTLFGKNSTAGLVHVITRDPASEFEAFGRLSYEEASEYPGSLVKTQVGASGPLTQNLGLRLTGFHKSIEGHLEDVLQNDNLPNTDVLGGRAKLRWDASDSLSFRLNVEYQRSDGESTPLVFRSVNPDAARRSPEINYGDENRQTKTYGNNRADSINRAVSLKTDWMLENVTLTSVTGWRNYYILRNIDIPDLDGERIDIIRNGGERNIHTFTQELRLTSNGDGAVEYTVGALWFNNRLSNDIERKVEDIPAEAVVTGVSPVDIPIALDALGLVPGESLSQYSLTTGGVDTQNLGIFAQGTWHITDLWHLTAGARHIREKLEANVWRQQFTQLDATGTHIADVAVDIPSATIKDNASTGLLSLQYDWSEASTVYGTFSTGYRGGAFDFANSDLEKAFSNPVDPETVVSFELGSKSRLFDDRLELNVALFSSVFKEFQAQVVDVGDNNSATNIAPSAEFRLANAGELETRGVEIDFQAKPFTSLFLFGSLLYNKAEFNEFVTQCFAGQEPGERGGVDGNGDGSCDFQDVAGGTLPNAPKWSASLTARYEHEFADEEGNVYLQLGGRWQDDVQFSAEQHPLTIQEAYSVWDLRTGWVGMNNRLEIAGYVKNLFQQRYVSGFFPLSAINDRRDLTHFIPRDSDRIMGVSLSYDF